MFSELRRKPIAVSIRVGAGRIAHRFNVDADEDAMREPVRVAISRIASRISDPLARDAALKISAEPTSHVEVLDETGQPRLVRDAEKFSDLPRMRRTNGEGGAVVEEVDLGLARGHRGGAR